MTLEEFIVDVERQEAVGVVAGNGECRLGEVVGTEGSEAIDGVNVIVIAGDFGAKGGNDFAAGDGGCRGLDHRAECVRNCEALFFLDLGGNLDGDFENGLDFGGDDHERDFDFGFRMFAFLNKFGGGVQNGLDLHLEDLGVGDGHTDRAVAEHRVLFLFQAAVVREELMERRVEQTDGHAIAVHDGHAVFEVFLGESIDGIEGFLGFGLVIAKQNFLNVRQTVAEEHVLCTEQANAAGTLVECRKRLGGFSIGADVEGLDFLAPVENGLSGFFELAGNGHGDFAEVNFAGRAGNRDVITTFYGVAVAAEGTGGFVDRDFGGTDDGRNAPCGLCGVCFEGRAISLRSIRTAFGAMPSGHTRLCARLCARPLCGLCAYAGWILIGQHKTWCYNHSLWSSAVVIITSLRAEGYVGRGK